jgi:uncharacterized membrane protein YfcA
MVMIPHLPWYLPLAFFIVALLYSSVGHGGASAYLAILVLMGFPRDQIAPTVLLLNLIVTSGGWFHFWKAGHFSWRLLLPFILTSVPAAFLGGSIHLSSQLFAWVLFAVLFSAGLRFLFLTRTIQPAVSLSQKQVYSIGLPAGLILGFVAGLVGIGGGIFLSPLILLLGWADAKQTAAISSAFIVLNSISGLAARFFGGTPDWELLIPLGLAVFLGGQVGSRLGARHFHPRLIQQILGLVLLIASLKLLPDLR